jgi:hypothetical protein
MNLLWAFVGVCALVRLVLAGIQCGEYTDGIVQITLFSNACAWFPPLFPAGVWLLSLLMDAELAGRLISVLATTMVLWPIYWMGQMLAPRLHVGALAVLIYSVLPVPNRWAVHAMSDALFVCLLAWALMHYLQALEGGHRAGRHAFLMMFISGMAALTRYQGLVLLLPVLHLLLRCRLRPSRLIAGSLPWVGLILWVAWRGCEHGAQFAERSGLPLRAYWDMGESFLVWLPWAVGWPAAWLCLVGWCRPSALVSWRRMAGVTWALAIILLLIQARFMSFQLRYLLPLMPLLAVWAAVGLVQLPRRWRPAVLVLTLVWSGTLSGAVMYHQRGAFADLRRVLGEPCRKTLAAAPAVYTNEPDYGGVAAPKTRYWLGGPVQSLPVPLNPEFVARLQPGDCVIVCEVYDPQGAIHAILAGSQVVQVIGTAESSWVPLLPDIMVQPPVTSQPTAMGYRYVRQQSRTVVLQVQ